MPTSVGLASLGDLAGWGASADSGAFCSHAAQRLAPRVGRLALRALQVALAEDHPDWTVARLATAANVPVGQARIVLRELETSGLARTIGTGTTQRRLIDDRSKALDWALAIERSRPNPRVTTTRVAAGDQAALLYRFVEIADRARVRYAVTSVVGAQLLSAVSIEPPGTLQIRVSGQAVEISRFLRRERANHTKCERSAILELWTDVGDLGTCDARHVCGISVASPLRVWLDLAGNDDRHSEVAQHFRECVVDRPTRMNIDEAARVFTDPKAYADEPRFHAACALLRWESPLTRVEVEGFNPFWAVTKYDDVMEISRQSDRWLNAPRPALGPKARDDSRATEMPIRSLVQMDAPDHPVYRHISSDWFKPKSIARLSERAAELAKRHVDRMAELDGECDFVTDVAVHYPLYVILSLMGLPEEDFPRMLQLTQELFGTADSELGRGTDHDDVIATLLSFFEYFEKLTDDRRAHPSDDLASVIANAEVDGEPIGIMEAVGYYVLIATAGHDTTSSAIAGGLPRWSTIPVNSSGSSTTRRSWRPPSKR